jgi:L-ascorbate metabolism protein UlaG (beta-lactamase superfamily)
MSHKISFFGHSAFRIITEQDLKIWIDPWLDNPQAVEKPDSEEADLILITHAHEDHIGNCMDMARSSATEVISIHEIQQYLLLKGLPNVTGMNLGGTYTTKGVTITMVPALHSSSIQEGNKILYGGVAVGYIIRLKKGLVLYHAGDTGLFGDMALIGGFYKPEIAMVPIGDHYTMGPREAACACKFLRPKKVIPMHYGTFPALTGTVKEFGEELRAQQVDTELVELKPGESISV